MIRRGLLRGDIGAEVGMVRKFQLCKYQGVGHRWEKKEVEVNRWWEHNLALLKVMLGRLGKLNNFENDVSG